MNNQRNKFDQDEELINSFNVKEFRRLLGYLRPHALKFTLALLAMTLASAAMLSAPILVKEAFDDALVNGNYHYLLEIVALLVGLYIVSLICGRYRTITMNYVGNKVIHTMRLDIFSHIQQLAAPYFDSRPHGKIMIRVVNYTYAISDLITDGLVSVISETFSLIITITFMFLLSPKLTIISLSILPLLFIVTMMIQKLQRSNWQAVSRKSSNLIAYLAESINGIKEVQNFVRHKRNLEIYDELNDELKTTWFHAVMVGSTFWPTIEIITFASMTLIYTTGVFWIEGGISIGLLVAFSTYNNRIWGPIDTLTSFYTSFIETTAYIERIFETIDEPIYVDDVEHATLLPPIRGDIRFDKVSFRYNSEETLRKLYFMVEEDRKNYEKTAQEQFPWVLKKLSFTIKAGQTAAIVGQTGSGKTTIASLIPRFYDIQEGAILLDGQDISKVTLNSLREQIGFMMQETFIFTGTIRDNIRYGRLNASDKEIEDAAKAICAHNFIMALPKGYETEVAEDGSNFSMGERQLISFARTLLADPKILILDEATSSIDSETEEALQQGLDRLLKGRTSIVIAHRLSTIRAADVIFYLDHGKILEQGSHDELMALKGHYYNKIEHRGA